MSISLFSSCFSAEKHLSATLDSVMEGGKALIELNYSLKWTRYHSAGKLLLGKFPFKQ